MGALLAPLLTGLLWAGTYAIAQLRFMSLKFDSAKVRRALAYGLPLVPHQIGHWLLNLSDRIILERSVPIGDLGVYGLGYNLGNLEQVAANAGNSALMPNYGKAAQDKQARARLPGLFADYLTWMAGVALAIAIFSDEFILTFMPPAFAGAAAITPWVTLGFFCVALYYGPMNSLTLIAGETRWVWLLTLIAGVVNVSANLILVPVFGIQAAAANTVVGYFVLFILVYVYEARFGGPRYDWSKIGGFCAALVGAIALDRLVLAGGLLEWLMDTTMLALFVLVFFRPRPA
jgi:O-antigen/teichoic acid export membrane protein